MKTVINERYNDSSQSHLCFFITVFQTRYVKEAKIDLKIGKDLFDWMFNEELEDQLEDLMKDFHILEV